MNMKQDKVMTLRDAVHEIIRITGFDASQRKGYMVLGVIEVDRQ